MTAREHLHPIGVAIPLKDPREGKQRLRSAGASAVEELVWRLAGQVIEACRPRPTYVVTESASVATFAHQLGVGVITTSAQSLNGAMGEAYERLSTQVKHLVIVHADLAQPAGLGDFTPDDGVTLFADHHRRGTTVLALPTGLDFHFSYGADSLARHAREVERLGVHYRVIFDSPWSRDVDTVADLT